MTWREHVWEFAIGMLAWVAAVGVVAVLVVFLGYEAVQRRRARGS